MFPPLPLWNTHAQSLLLLQLVPQAPNFNVDWEQSGPMISPGVAVNIEIWGQGADIRAYPDSWVPYKKKNIISVCPRAIWKFGVRGHSRGTSKVLTALNIRFIISGCPRPTFRFRVQRKNMEHKLNSSWPQQSDRVLSIRPGPTIHFWARCKSRSIWQMNHCDQQIYFFLSPRPWPTLRLQIRKILGPIKNVEFTWRWPKMILQYCEEDSNILSSTVSGPVFIQFKFPAKSVEEHSICKQNLEHRKHVDGHRQQFHHIGMSYTSYEILNCRARHKHRKIKQIVNGHRKQCHHVCVS